MRKPDEVTPSPKTSEEIIEHGLREIASLAPGVHGSDPCYDARRTIKDYALTILAAAEAAKAAEDVWYIAECQDCVPVLPQPFTSATERGEWAEAHRRTGHTVTTREESRVNT